MFVFKAAEYFIFLKSSFSKCCYTMKYYILISFSIERFSKEMTWSLPHLSDVFSLFFSIFAILDPNCMPHFGRRAEVVRLSSTAARCKISFSPILWDKVKFALSQTGRKFRKETFSCGKGNLPSFPWSPIIVITTKISRRNSTQFHLNFLIHSSGPCVLK